MVILRRIRVQSISLDKVFQFANLHVISAHNFTKISLLTAYVLVHSFDVICLSKTYLISETLTDDKNLETPNNLEILFVAR